MIITGADLVSYPGVVGTPESLDDLAALASDLVEDAWASPEVPEPLWVINIAKAAAARAFWNPKGLEMLSRQVDDAKRTEQFSKEFAGRVGVFLTDSEMALLAGVQPGAVVRTIRTTSPGWCN